MDLYTVALKYSGLESFIFNDQNCAKRCEMDKIKEK